VIQASIERSRKLRQNIENEYKNGLFHFSPDKEHQALAKEEEKEFFVRTSDQLLERIKENMATFIDSHKRRYGESATAQNRERLLSGYETRLREFENQYLYQDSKGQLLPVTEQENLFSLHILKALASSLDSHTSFYQASEAYDMRIRLQKEFLGIGLVLKDAAEGVKVTHMLENGPAAQSGLIKLGDVLIQVDNESVVDHPFEKVMEMLHGEKNDKVKLTFKRKGEAGKPDQIYTVELVREEIIVNNDRVDVSSEPFGNGIIGKITLHAFYQGNGVSSEKDVREAIQKLEKQGNLRGLILDLRNNSGGFLSQAVKVAGLFITNGVIVISKYSSGEERFYRDVDGKMAYDGPLVVLTSKATASAAEIVAQALQDYGVALVVGDEHTYGKGTIQTQTVTDNQSASYFKVTVGKYYTVSGHTPQKEGVKADIVAPGHWSRERIGESYMDSVDADIIPPSYDDKLTDVPPDIRSWYLKYYIPTLQHRTNEWRNLLPALRKNSEYRLAHNKNYQFYLKGDKPSTDEEASEEEEDEWDLTDKKNKTYGEDDLHMQEAVNILKDMVLLHNIQKK
jgi:carboxyl-terminal processing protease